MKHQCTVDGLRLALRATQERSIGRRRTLAVLGFALASVLARGARADGEAVTGPSFLLMTRAQSAPTQEQREAIGRSGGKVVQEYPEIGTLVVQASDPSFRTAAAAIPGVSSVVPNLPLKAIENGATAGGNITAALSPTDEPLYAVQWGLQAIHVQSVWDAGYTGAGARVAVLDNNFDLSHPDLAPNIDAGLARSFVPGEPVTPPPDALDSHGTHVAGLIAATANGVGTVGVAPSAQLIPIKVLDNANNILLPWFLDGVNYAIAVHADVANMSFRVALPMEGGCFPPPYGCLTAKDARDIATLVQRAVLLARRNGVTVLAMAGNEQLELNRRDDLLVIPAEIKGALTVSALGPIGWALDPSTDLDVPESYTSYGKRVVYLSGPGGSRDFSEGPACDLSVGLGLGPIPCQRFDTMLSTNFPAPYAFDGGSGHATAHVAGVVALMVEKHGGPMPPGLVQAILRKSADDLGPPGRDDFFGWGRVNAEKAVQLTR
jgi:subtilisin family serine protease